MIRFFCFDRGLSFLSLKKRGGIKRYVKILLILLAIGVCGPVEADLIGSIMEDSGFGTNSIINTTDIDIIAGDKLEGPMAKLFDSLVF